MVGFGWRADDACHLSARPPMRGQWKHRGTLWSVTGYITWGGVQVSFKFICVYLPPPPTPSHFFIVESVPGRAATHVLDCCCIIVIRIFLLVQTGFAVVLRIKIESTGAAVGGAVGVAADGSFSVGKVVGCV